MNEELRQNLDEVDQMTIQMYESPVSVTRAPGELAVRGESGAQRKQRLRQVTRVPLTTERVPRGRPRTPGLRCVIGVDFGTVAPAVVVFAREADAGRLRLPFPLTADGRTVEEQLLGISQREWRRLAEGQFTPSERE